MKNQKVTEETFSNHWLRREPKSKKWFIRFKYKQYANSSDNLHTFIQEECY